MSFYQKNGLKPGARLRVKDVATYNSTITVQLDGNDVTLGIPAAQSLRIIVEEPRAARAIVAHDS
jgi:Fe2+ transport system protein FeoA